MKAKKIIRIILRIILVIFLLLFLTVLSYFLYMYIAYYRLDDLLVLNVNNKGNSKGAVTTDTTYSIMTFNIGYGAYEDDYSFFMTGGKYSWAFSKERLKSNMDGMANDIKGVHSDFVMLQEVDVDGTRTYHFDELFFLETQLGYSNYVYAQNYDSPFLFYPFLEPHGSNKAGILTATSFNITESIRRSLPIATNINKFLDLDRCYSISQIPVDNGKNLTLINLHLSAYGGNASIRENQVKLLSQDMEREIEVGNYVIVGGDFNHNLRVGNYTDYPDWAQQFPRDALPTNTTFAFEIAKINNTDHNSARSNSKPYEKDVTFTVLLDGFIVSSNVEVEYNESLDWEFKRSDHDPVYMKFKLKQKNKKTQGLFNN